MSGARGIVLVGAGGHARVVVEAMGRDVAIVGHIALVGSGAGVAAGSMGPWLGAEEAIRPLIASGHAFALGIGFVDRAGAVRRTRIVANLDAAELVAVLHERAVVAPSATVGRGTFVAAGAVVATAVTIGVAAIVNTGAVVDHDCRLGRNVHIASGATLSGGVIVGDNTLVGAGSTVLQGVAIGRDVVVGAGAVVVGDVADGESVVGVPARPVSR